MKTTVYFQDFERAFHDMDRKDNFSHYGLRQLFDYIEELEESIGETLELDVVALCCDYTEYSSIKEVCDTYSFEFEYDEDDDADTIAESFQDYLIEHDYYVVCCEADCIIIQDC